MATLAVDTPRVFETGIEPIFNDLPVIAADIIYEGSAVGIQTTTGSDKGYARPCTTSDEFAGFCVKKVDNSAGAAGALTVKVRQQGIAKLAVTGASAVTNINDAVYLTDDNTFTLTASGGLQIGKVHRWVTGTTCMVLFQALSVRSV